jgi:hypothetical protein
MEEEGFDCAAAKLVSTPKAIRLLLNLLLSGIIFFLLSSGAKAQDDSNDVPLGDLARSLRTKKAVPAEVVIDNDNFSEVVDEAEKKKEAGSTMVFSLEPGGKDFQVSSPDVSCSFSFSAKVSSLLTDPAALNELPRSELAKLDGPATIDGDSLQVSVHNGSSWDLREVVIGLTILRRSDSSASAYGQAHLVPAAATGINHQEMGALQKQPDTTVLLRVKGSAPPATTALFRTQLNFALFPDQEWHWAIVKAKGIAPQSASPSTAAVPIEPVVPSPHPPQTRLNAAAN